jgi:hypothetical protein
MNAWLHPDLGCLPLLHATYNVIITILQHRYKMFGMETATLSEKEDVSSNEHIQ